MRVDMAKVIVERPRWGSDLPSKKRGYRRSLQKSDIADLPRKEPLAGRWRGMQRALSENLSPMFRFLQSQIGRPWNKVHQDLCEHVSFDNAVQKHVLTHVFDFVTLHVTLVDGRPHGRRHYGPRHRLEPGQMYVCPRTGLLKIVRPLKSKAPTKYGLGSLRQYHFYEGFWWELKLRKIPAERRELWDVWLERPVARLTPAVAHATYGGWLFTTAKRPLSPREARTLRRARKA
jgi:hypothetical protein